MKLPPWLWRSFASRRTRIALICSPFVLSIGLVAFYGGVNWWGPREFERSLAEIKAAGLPVTIDEAYGIFPEEQDVLKHPVMIAELARPREEMLQGIRSMPVSGFTKDSKVWRCIPDRDLRPDVTKWANPARPGQSEAEVAKHLLGVIKPETDRYRAMKEAFARPRARWSEDKEMSSSSERRALRFGRLPQFGAELAALEIAAGEIDAAAADILIIADFIVAESRRNNAFGFFMAAVGHQQLFDITWQGIDRGVWSDSQLLSFQTALARLDFQKAAVTAIETEIAWAIPRIRKSDYHYFTEVRDAFPWSEVRDSFLEGVMQMEGGEVSTAFQKAWRKTRPMGFDYLDVAEYFRALRSEGVYRGSERRTQFTPEDVRQFEDTASPDFYRLDAPMTLRAIGEKVLLIETRLNLLRCGIALERYRLKYGTTPEKLEAVVPEFLATIPLDVCDHQPLRYQRLPDGSPHVWSLWPSGKDEGGMPRQGNEKGNAVWTTGAIPRLTDAVYKR